ncbi:inositol polyphosphate-5-phosphatase A-like [Garra rufa]|uniref:inositol polyphosphate-5-phosphatase A-like n=1 Tax=Garra rufa TaxID=137080 RepID=UPI003CCEBFA3
MAALVAAERHLWLTLSSMKDKDRVLLIDAPLPPSGLFGDSVNEVVDRHQEAKRQAATPTGVLREGPVLGAPCRRVTQATDASLTGWGTVMSGRSARVSPDRGVIPLTSWQVPQAEILRCPGQVGAIWLDPPDSMLSFPPSNTDTRQGFGIMEAWTVQAHQPHFVALHFQEVGGKDYKTSMKHVDSFIKELLSSDAMKDFNRAPVYLDKDYESQEQFTALGCCYFIHESLKNIQQFDFKAKKFRKVVGEEVHSDTLPSTATLEKEKFPKDQFPKGRKGFIRTRWMLADCAFDLVNIHLFHDESNLVAMEKSPSVYSGTRQKALDFVLNRVTGLSRPLRSQRPSAEHGASITDQRYERLPYFIFGDFNFRLDCKQVIELRFSDAGNTFTGKQSNSERRLRPQQPEITERPDQTDPASSHLTLTAALALIRSIAA